MLRIKRLHGHGRFRVQDLSEIDCRHHVIYVIFPLFYFDGADRALALVVIWFLYRVVEIEGVFHRLVGPCVILTALSSTLLYLNRLHAGCRETARCFQIVYLILISILARTLTLKRRGSKAADTERSGDWLYCW